MNLLTKPMPWMVASLLAAASVFGQTQSQSQSQSHSQPQSSCGRAPTVCKPQPKCGPLQEPPVPTVCAYNAPAEINIGMQGDYNFYTSASFLYWQPTQDNSAVALIDDLSTAFSPSGNFSGSFAEMDFDFKPGFKVAMGLNLQHDDWDLYAEYTRVHGKHTTSSNGSATGPANGSVFATWGHPTLLNGLSAQQFKSVNASFTNNLDFVDLDMGRTYYVGTRLVFRPAFAVRGAWIMESMSVHYHTNLSTTYASGPVNVVSRSHTWAVGPRAGLMTDWLLGCGFRIYGSGYGDILYTKYKLGDKTVFTSNTTGAVTTFTTHDKVGVLRTHLDLELGLGWGMYLDNNNWHIDLLAGYGFQVFFDQNMFRQFESALVVGKNSAPNGNLYVQGLTVTLRLDY